MPHVDTKFYNRKYYFYDSEMAESTTSKLVFLKKNHLYIINYIIHTS